MGSKFGTRHEKKWINKALCRLRKFKPVIPQRKLPTAKMDHVLEKVVGANRMSMIDIFSRYNQIVFHEDDK
jgi:hypothetical protein